MKHTIITKTEIEFYPIMGNDYIVKTSSMGNSLTFNVDEENLQKLLIAEPYETKKNEYSFLSDEETTTLRKNHFGINLNKITLWDAAKLGLTNPSNLCIGNYWDDGIMHFYDGRNIPCGIVIDYIQANMSDVAYDIDKAFDILSQNPNIHQLQKLDVPYYNCVHPNQKYLFFVWEVPDHLCEEISENIYNKEQYIFDNDLLGLRSSGAALYDNFYKVTE